MKDSRLSTWDGGDTEVRVPKSSVMPLALLWGFLSKEAVEAVVLKALARPSLDEVALTLTGGGKATKRRLPAINVA